MNLYAILGISPDADEEAIRMAYRMLARRYHPDMGSGSSVEKFRQVTEAYETLSDPWRRQAYDRSLQKPRPIPRRSSTVPAEPIGVQPEPIAARSRSMPWAQRRAFPAFLDLDPLFDSLMDWFEDDPFFFGGRWRW